MHKLTHLIQIISNSDAAFNSAVRIKVCFDFKLGVVAAKGRNKAVKAFNFIYNFIESCLALAETTAFFSRVQTTCLVLSLLARFNW